MKTITIDGSKHIDFDTFHSDIVQTFTEGYDDWNIGFDSFNDVLYGGFGKYETDENIILIWKNFTQSHESMGTEYSDVILEIIKDHKSHIEFILEW